MRKTKEEIHGSIYDKGSITVGSATREEHLNAMQEYADQEMEAFAEWVGKNYLFGNKAWCHRFADQRDKDNWLTTQQLIQKYKEERDQ